MEKSKKWNGRSLTVRVTNRICGRTDVHKNISQDEADWIALSPNLFVEILQDSYREREE
jgi:hypothetical protein